MRRRKPRGRKINGIVVLDKPLGITSNDAVQAVKRLFKAAKAGHTGSLDPLASGLLPICLGEATKLAGFLLDTEKHYRTVGKLGEITATGDAEGEIIERGDVPELDRDKIEAVLENFRGEIEQIPPMYSALKHKGQPLYKLARQGIEIEREPRRVTVYELELLDFGPDTLSLRAVCSRGTYIRTLVEDIGKALGCGAHIIELRRTGVGPYREEHGVSLESLEQVAENGLEALDQRLLAVDSALTDWPEVKMNADLTYYLRQGQPVQVPRAPTEGGVRLYSTEGDFLGVGEILDDGRVAPKRLLKLT